MRGTRIDPEACGILCPVKRVDGGKGSADSTSSPANSILRAKGPRHDRTHDQRNAEIAPDQRALSRCRFGKSLSRWPFHLARLSLSSSMWPSALAASVTLSSRPRRWLAVPARGTHSGFRTAKCRRSWDVSNRRGAHPGIVFDRDRAFLRSLGEDVGFVNAHHPHRPDDTSASTHRTFRAASMST